jgi:hypothetical protein
MAVSAMAQASGDPPPLLQITRIPHGAKVDRPYATAKAAVDVIGMASMTGLPESWLVESHINFTSVEDLDTALRAHVTPGRSNEFGEAQPDELLGGPRTMLAVYERQFSIRAAEAIRIFPKTRYFRVSIYRDKPTSSQTISAVSQELRQEYAPVNLVRPQLVYRVISGAPASTYIVLAPLTSLRQIDDAVLQVPAYLEPGAGSTSDHEVGREHLMFRVEPQLSYVSTEFAGEDAAYWKPQRQ